MKISSVGCRLGLAAFSLAVACREPIPASIVVMPRAARLAEDERAAIQGLAYAPTHLALGWRGRDSLVVGHVESYVRGDVTANTCAGTGVYVLALLQGGAAVAMHAGAPLCTATWASGVTLTPRARELVFASALSVNASRILRFRFADGTLDTISRRCVPHAEEPALSHDGALLAVRGLCDGRTQREWAVHVGRFGADEWRRVAGGDTVSAVQPTWSPDGRSIAVRLGGATASSAARRIAVVSIASNVVRALVPGASPSWSPDGQWIAYVQTNPESGEDDEIRLIRPDGSSARTLFRNQARTTYVRGFGPQREGGVRPPLLWTPDSRALVFGRAFDRGVLLWHIAIDDEQPRQVTEATQR